MTSRRPSVGDIWLAYVEFADHPGIGKVRPVVVIDVQISTCIVVAAKVTSRAPSQESPEELPIIDWEECGLRKPSYVRLDQKLELAFESLLSDAPLGSLSDACVSIIAEKLRNIP